MPKSRTTSRVAARGPTIWSDYPACSRPPYPPPYGGRRRSARRRERRDPWKGILLTMTRSGSLAVGQDTPRVEQAIDALLHPVQLYSAADCLCRPSPVPKSPGVYAWYFDAPPGVSVEGCHCALGHTLLYVGIAPKETKDQTTKPSVRTLRHRMRDHYGGNAEGSTLRLTLGCLLSDNLNIKLRRVGSGKRHTSATTSAGLRLLPLFPLLLSHPKSILGRTLEFPPW